MFGWLNLSQFIANTALLDLVSKYNLILPPNTWGNAAVMPSAPASYPYLQLGLPLHFKKKADQHLQTPPPSIPQ